MKCGKQLADDGTTKEGCCHHIIGRANGNTKFALMNSALLCKKCHDYADGDREGFREFLREDWPVMYKWHMENHWKPQAHISVIDLQNTIAELKAFIKEQEARRGK